MMYCSRCGTPLRAGDRFCPRCGAAVPGVPGALGRKGAKGRGVRTVWIVLAMVLMVLVLLAAAVYTQWDQMGELFEEQRPMPTPRPGQAGVEQLEDRLPRDEAGSLILEPVERTFFDLPDRACTMAEEAGQQALERIYGSEPITTGEAEALFCNLSAGGYESFAALARKLNQTSIGTLGDSWEVLSGPPVVRGNRAYQSVLLYAVLHSPSDPMKLPWLIGQDVRTKELLICMIWSGSSWRVDASTMAEFMLNSHQRFLFSDGLREAADAGRPVFFIAGAGTLLEPVIPNVCDTLIREIYATADGGAAICCWAFNGSNQPCDTNHVLVQLYSNTHGWYANLDELPIEPLHLEPGEGRVLTVVIPGGQMQKPLADQANLTARVILCQPS